MTAGRREEEGSPQIGSNSCCGHCWIQRPHGRGERRRPGRAAIDPPTAFWRKPDFRDLKVIAPVGEGGQLFQGAPLQLGLFLAVKRAGCGVSCRAASCYLRTVNAVRLMLAPVRLPFTLMSNDTV